MACKSTAEFATAGRFSLTPEQLNFLIRREIENHPEVPPLTVELWFLQSFPASRGGLHNFLTIGPNYPQIHGHHQPEIASAIPLPVVSTTPPTMPIPLTDEEKEIIRELEGINGRALLNSAPERVRLGTILDRIEKMNSPTLLFNRELVYVWGCLGDFGNWMGPKITPETAPLLSKLAGLIDRIYATHTSDAVPSRFSEFSCDQLKVLLTNTWAMDFTKGCSVRCPFCCYNAQRGVTDHIPFSEIIYLMRNFDSPRNPYIRGPIKENIPLNLFNASEPLDYQDGVFTIEDIYALIFFYLRGPLNIVTALPKHREDIFWRLYRKDWISLISLHRTSFPNASGSYGLLEPDGTTTDGREKYRIVKGVSPAKFRVFPDVRDRLELVEEKWRDNGDGSFISLNEGEEFYTPGEFIEFGRNYGGSYFHQDPTSLMNCGMNGIVMDADGFHNVVQVKVSPEHKTGEVRVRITPENFSAEYNYVVDWKAHDLQRVLRENIVVIDGGIGSFAVETGNGLVWHFEYDKFQ